MLGGAAGVLLLLGAPAAADTSAAKPKPGTSLVGDIVIFNDEIVEPVSVPVSVCGTSVSSDAAKPRCGRTNVSDDDA